METNLSQPLPVQAESQDLAVQIEELTREITHLREQAVLLEATRRSTWRRVGLILGLLLHALWSLLIISALLPLWNPRYNTIGVFVAACIYLVPVAFGIYLHTRSLLRYSRNVRPPMVTWPRGSVLVLLAAAPVAIAARMVGHSSVAYWVGGLALALSLCHLHWHRTKPSSRQPTASSKAV